MAEFRYLATTDGGSCFLCGEAIAPFIDTGVNHQIAGRIYICASTDKRVGCSRQIGRLDGLYEPYSIEEINSRLDMAIEAATPLLLRVMEEKTAESVANLEALSDAVIKLATTKLVPAAEVFDLGVRAAETPEKEKQGQDA